MSRKSGRINKKEEKGRGEKGISNQTLIGCLLVPSKVTQEAHVYCNMAAPCGCLSIWGDETPTWGVDI